VRLIDLEPDLKPGQLTFWCPLCGDHKIRISLKTGEPDATRWSMVGTLENMTVKPSIRSDTPPRCHWHGYITDGAIVTLSDSKLRPPTPG
jgi:hypothetical protein